MLLADMAGLALRAIWEWAIQEIKFPLSALNEATLIQL